MKTIVERSTFLKALNHVQSVVEKRNTIPILSNVLLSADNNMLALTATDLDLEIREKIDAEVAMAGVITAPAHMLFDIVRRLPEGAQIELSISPENDRLILSSGVARFEMQTLPRDDFPTVTSDEMPVAFALAASDLLHLIKKTSFAISQEETRYYLNGIYLHTVEEDAAVLRAVATDGHRLARVQIPMPVGASGMPAIIVPRKAVQQIEKLLDEAESEVSIQVSDTKINFAFDHIVLTSKLIDGKFPDYNRVIPEQNDKSLEVESLAFSQSVDRVSAISLEKSRAVKLSLEPNQLVLTVSNPEGGNATDKLTVSYGDEAMDIGFNARYLLDIAGQLGGEKAIFELSDPASPTIIRDDEDPSALYVLMPMRV